MSEQKLLSAPAQRLLLSDHFFRIPKFAVSPNTKNFSRWENAGKPKIIDGGRTGEHPCAIRPLCKPPELVKENDWKTPGIPDHLIDMHRHFQLALIERKRIFTVYFNLNTRQLIPSSHYAPEEAFKDAVNRALHNSQLILSLETQIDFASQLNNKNGPYISPMHCIETDSPIVTAGTLREPTKNPIDPCPPEY